MKDHDRYKLLHGPYKTPRIRIGRTVFCEVQGEVTVAGYTEGRIPWPITRKKGGWPQVIVFRGLAKAIRCESEIAIRFWWGVCNTTIWKWRKAPGVPQFNEGSTRLHRDYAPKRFTPDVQERARAAANSPEANAKKSAWRKGRPIHPNTLAALEAHRGQLHSEESRRKVSKTLRRIGHRPPTGRVWTPEWDALLGVLEDAEVAERTGRTICSIQSRRYVLRIPLPGRNKLRSGG